MEPLEPDALNKHYWSHVAPEKILTGHYMPGDELMSLLAPGAKILDVGSGTGKVAESLHAKGYAVTGIDINAAALSEARARNQDITYIEADVTKPLPFEDASFDCISMAYVLVSIIDSKNARSAATEILRLLKPGGLLWIAEATYSKDYEQRYKEGKAATGLDTVALSYSKKSDEKGSIERVIRHYSSDEIQTLFNPLEKVSSKQVSVTSQSSGMTVETLVCVFKKSSTIFDAKVGAANM